jgi:hypothetical protein
MAHLDWSSTADSDPRQSAATRRDLFSRFADTPTLVMGGHFDAAISGARAMPSSSSPWRDPGNLPGRRVAAMQRAVGH